MPDPIGEARHQNTVEYILTEKAFDLLNPATNNISVFISYSRKVSPFQALLLSNWLHRNNIENFLDINNMDGSGELLPFIKDAIKSRSHFICLLGQTEIDGEKVNSLNSPWVRQEIQYAIHESKLCIPFIQHDWLIDTLLFEEQYLYKQIINKYKGVEVTTPSFDKQSNIIKVYDTALRDILPLLNKSRI